MNLFYRRVMTLIFSVFLSTLSLASNLETRERIVNGFIDYITTLSPHVDYNSEQQRIQEMLLEFFDDEASKEKLLSPYDYGDLQLNYLADNTDFL